MTKRSPDSCYCWRHLHHTWRRSFGRRSATGFHPTAAVSRCLRVAYHVATVSVPVQVNGRTRGVVQLSPEANQAQALEAARQVEAVRHALDDAPVRRIVSVPRRMLNIVTT